MVTAGPYFFRKHSALKQHNSSFTFTNKLYIYKALICGSSRIGTEDLGNTIVLGTQPGSESGRYGFNNMEKDDELKGAGNSYDFGARLYDLRVGRWLSVDPSFKSYIAWSPYNFAFNNPIIFDDKSGGDPQVTITKSEDGKTITDNVTNKTYIVAKNKEQQKLITASKASEAPNYLTSGSSTTSTGVVVNINIVTTVEVVESEEEAEKRKEADGYGIIVTYDKNSESPFEYNDDKDKISYGYKAKKGSQLAHEIAHDMGLGEKYVVKLEYVETGPMMQELMVTGQYVLAGYENSLMGTGWSPLTQKEIDDMATQIAAHYADLQNGQSKTFIGPVIPLVKQISDGEHQVKSMTPNQETQQFDYGEEETVNTKNGQVIQEEKK